MQSHKCGDSNARAHAARAARAATEHEDCHIESKRG